MWTLYSTASASSITIPHNAQAPAHFDTLVGQYSSQDMMSGADQAPPGGVSGTDRQSLDRVLVRGSAGATAEIFIDLSQFSAVQYVAV